MIATDQQTVLVGSFPARSRAEQFVAELRHAGFRDAQIGVAAPADESASPQLEDTALAGALTGGTIGMLAGLALTASLIPGIGPVLAGGVLAGVIGGGA